MTITLADYFMGRDVSHAAELTDAVRANAVETVRRVNLVLVAAAADGVEPGRDQVTQTPVASGWRPKGINARTSNAAARSTHLTAEGCDIQDSRNRALARWCIKHEAVLVEVGLWCEDFRWTAGKNLDDPWVHFQTRAPKSGNRIFVPSSAPPQAAPLPGQRK